MTMSWEAPYIVAGLVLAWYYVPQVRLCLTDRSGLQGYSLSKGLIQLAMRLAMMPFLFATVDHALILSIQALDLALRAVEVFSAVWSLRQQGFAWNVIAQRALDRAAAGLGAKPRGHHEAAVLAALALTVDANAALNASVDRQHAGDCADANEARAVPWYGTEQA